jgi:hypothetical protein
MLQRVDNNQHWKQTPTYLPDFLHGQLTIKGSFKFWLGGLTRHFKGEATGKWCDDVLVLDESFQYDNRRSEQRTWRLKFGPDGALTSTCVDVVGAGTGRFKGHCYTHKYLFRLPIGRNGLVVRVNETYEPLDDARILCNAKLSRWGIPLGTIRMQFERY